jgi:hypothetical protein
MRMNRVVTACVFASAVVGTGAAEACVDPPDPANTIIRDAIILAPYPGVQMRLILAIHG